jgi:putative tryptophan/tyrosine transport system substrate-binding protein
MPVVGLFDPRLSSDTPVGHSARVSQDLREAGYVEGEDVAIEYRWADNQIDRLPALASDLVHILSTVSMSAASRQASTSNYSGRAR